MPWNIQSPSDLVLFAMPELSKEQLEPSDWIGASLGFKSTHTHIKGSDMKKEARTSLTKTHENNVWSALVAGCELVGRSLAIPASECNNQTASLVCFWKLSHHTR